MSLLSFLHGKTISCFPVIVVRPMVWAKALFFGLAISCETISASGADHVDADLLLVGGTIFDGTGQPGVVGDVAVRGDRIVAVGDFETNQVGRTIDCTGLFIAPGFIDLHNHSDASLEIKDETTGEKRTTRNIYSETMRSSACYLTQGCTTMVTGNCGGGAWDVGEYYRRIEENLPGVNIAQLIPHGALRAQVIGRTRRDPTADELQQMQHLARQAMEDGAWGMSTGLIYVPGTYSKTDELVTIAQVVGEFDGIYASHIRSEGDRLIEAIEEALEIGRRGNLPVHVSHLKASKRRNWGKVRMAARVIERARDEGQQVTADQYPYNASSTSISAMLLSGVEREGGNRALSNRLSDPEQRQKIRKVVAKNLENRGRIMVASCPAYPQWIGKMICDVAEEEKREAVDVALDILSTGNAKGVSFSMDERDVCFVMTLPWVATASDGATKIDDGTRPHPRSYGTFPRRIGRYAIEERIVPVEQAIRSASGLPADILGLPDRGYLRVDHFADIVAFDPATFRDHATFQSPFEISTGVRWLFVNGQTAIENGRLEVVNAGRVLRKSAPEEN